ncbi:dethiobiotin synthase [Arenibacter sp. GZD96]|uniref:dethiobiotin synthase n=1 Tax=Aurantibrevibacter litoralis TaxID=3106030 RepID=UPI002B001219|nr:dethiobiotin synthase [Arenibacter sp. GZD-96]MEA1787234.1 dethiobiotin synthase [Arenibacter sp. GZD-96]
MQHIFVTGISTNVGKTMVCAILAEALEADYWKPVQAGDLEYTDSDRVTSLISNSKTVIHPSKYQLKNALSPHAAAALENITIDINRIEEPATENHLIIEGAGGILVPLTDSDTILDLIMPNYKVVVVSQHYLGSINHTLLTVLWLQQRGYEVAIIFNGSENKDTERVILKKTGATFLGRLEHEPDFNKSTVKKYATLWQKDLLLL